MWFVIGLVAGLMIGASIAGPLGFMFGHDFAQYEIGRTPEWKKEDGSSTD